MNSFVQDFLDAPLLIDLVQGAVQRVRRYNRLANDMYSMSDMELADLRISRADIPHVLREAREADEAAARIH